MLSSINRRSVLPVLAFLLIGCTACGSTKNSMTPDETRPIQKPAIAPGTIRLQATMGICTARERWTDCESKVVLVFEYGSGTPQLPNGTDLRVMLLNSQLDDIRAQTPRLLENGSVVEMVIAFQRTTDPANTHPDWKVVSISEAKS